MGNVSWIGHSPGRVRRAWPPPCLHVTGAWEGFSLGVSSQFVSARSASLSWEEWLQFFKWFVGSAAYSVTCILEDCPDRPIILHPLRPDQSLLQWAVICLRLLETVDLSYEGQLYPDGAQSSAFLGYLSQPSGFLDFQVFKWRPYPLSCFLNCCCVLKWGKAFGIARPTFNGFP